MFGKIFAGLVMGIIIAILASMVFAVGSGGGAEGGKAGLWAGVFGFVLMMVLAVTARRAKFAWGRGLLICGLLCFAMPLATVVFTAIFGAHSVGNEVTAGGRAGAAIGSLMAGTAMTVVAGVMGFFAGLIFLIGSFFSLRGA